MRYTQELDEVASREEQDLHRFEILELSKKIKQLNDQTIR